jgi:hypothetical protein
MTTPNSQTHTLRFITLPRVLWWTIATALIVVGFVLDGISEAGHHAGFILAGIALGLSFRVRK